MLKDRLPRQGERVFVSRPDCLSVSLGDCVAGGGWVLEPPGWEMSDSLASTATVRETTTRPRTAADTQSADAIGSIAQGAAELSQKTPRRAAGWRRWLGVATVALATASLGLAPAPASAEGRIRISEQFGIIYLLLNVLRDQQLVEKHGKAQGIDVTVEWTRLSGGANVNDALLSGSIDIAAAGVGPLLTAWDRTAGRQNVRGVAGLGNFPLLLLSSNPAVRSIEDLSENDRIAVPSVGVSIQSRFLQIAAARRYGDAEFNRFDKLTVALPHPDATAALLGGGTEINGHFSNPPFQYQALANPAVKVVLDSYDVVGGPNTPTVLFATERFRRDNPKTYRAFVDALAEASDFIAGDKGRAVDIYLRVSGAKIDRAALLKIVEDPRIEFTITPTRTFAIASFLHRVGAIRNKPASWQDYFFADERIADGS